MRIFISHIHQESKLAGVLKEWIETTFVGQYTVFVSSDGESIKPGERWQERISEALEEAKALLVLCSRSSVKHAWVNFEAGCGYAKRVPVVPLCHSGMTKDTLPMPLSLLQAFDIQEEDFAKSLICLLAEHGGISKIPRISFSDMQEELIQATADSEADEEEASRSATSQTGKKLSELSMTATDVLALYICEDVNKMFDRDVHEDLSGRHKFIQVEAALDELVDHGFLARGIERFDGMPYALTREARRQLAEVQQRRGQSADEN